MQHFWTADGEEPHLDKADQISSFFAQQAFTQALGRIPSGNIPTTERVPLRSGKTLAEKMHL